MQTYTLLAALFAGLTIAQDLSAIQNLPACGKACITSMLGKADQLGCKPSDINCLCNNKDFGFGVRDCTNESCPADADKASVIDAGSSFCTQALAAAKGSSGASTTTTATETGASTTVTATSNSTEKGAAGAVITTTNSEGSTYTTTLASSTGTEMGGMGGNMTTTGVASASSGFTSVIGANGTETAGTNSSLVTASNSLSSVTSAISSLASSISSAASGATATSSSKTGNAAVAQATAFAGFVGLAGIAAAALL